jgi:hypothetical protein
MTAVGCISVEPRWTRLCLKLPIASANLALQNYSSIKKIKFD